MEKDAVKITALVPAAGSGRRMASGTDNKPFIELAGKPVIIHTLCVLERSDLIDDIKLITKERYMDEAGRLLDEYGLRKVSEIIAGGDTRTQSVYNGLVAINAGDDDLVLIHDGVRPFVTEDMLRRAIEGARSSGAAVAGVPCTATIKIVGPDGAIERTPDRRRLWEAQTPQVFRYEILKRAYAIKRRDAVTDDAALVEATGHVITMVSGSPANIKITVPEDLILGEAILKSRG